MRDMGCGAILQLAPCNAVLNCTALQRDMPSVLDTLRELAGVRAPSGRSAHAPSGALLARFQAGLGGQRVAGGEYAWRICVAR